MKHLLKRTFHPIGQGAFYSEMNINRKVKSRQVNAVFDCGSLDKSVLKNYISTNYLPSTTDIAFLSHFHVDHYNGIKYLKPKYLVIPFLTELEKLIVWIENLIENEIYYEDFDDLVNQISPESIIIYVLPFNDDSPIGDTQGAFLISDNTPRNPGEKVSSFQKIIFDRMPNWAYIPINPKINDKYINIFEKELEKRGVILHKLYDFKYDYFIQNKTHIKAAYDCVKHYNEFSMVVYSCPTIELKSEIRWLQLKTQYKHICCSKFTNIKCGCMYLGDISLKSKIKKNILQVIYELLPSDIKDDLGTIQIPHHGSDENFNEKIFEYYDKKNNIWEKWPEDINYVISAGKGNPYGHPGIYVLKSLLISPYSFFIVSQIPSSQVTQIYIYNACLFYY